MKTAFMRFAWMPLVAGQLALAQAATPPVAPSAPARPPVEDFKAATSNQPGKQYPQINSERRARFRIVAPQAQNVRVNLRGTIPLTKGQDGAWTGTSAVLDEGFHYYTITVDGAEVPDPNTLYFYGTGRWGSGLEVPARDDEFYALKDVPHGQLRQQLYHSTVTGVWRRCFVYTPPDYETNQQTRYGVLYLQHGMDEDESGWGAQGKANLILDNLIAAKKAVPMIIVMDNGYATRADSGPQPTRGGAGAAGRGGGGNAAFEDVMIKDIIPMIDANYRTRADREHRAMAGLSMGGNQTCQITFHNLDRFAYIGAFSGTMNGLSADPLDPTTAFNGIFKDGAALNRQIKFLFVGKGTKEPNPFPGSIGAFRAMLDKAEVKFTYYESPDTAHEWLTWRRDLYQFAPVLFRD